MKCKRCGNDTDKYSLCDECRKYFRKRYREKVFHQTKIFFIKEDDKWDISTNKKNFNNACCFVSFQEYEEVLSKFELKSFIENLKFILNEDMILCNYAKNKHDKFNRFKEFVEKNKVKIKKRRFLNVKRKSKKII